MRVWPKINIAVQGLVLFASLIALVSEPLLALAGAIPLGVWQVISGIVFAIRSNLLSKNNKLFVTIYLILTAMVLSLLLIVYRNQYFIHEFEELVIGSIATISGILAIAFFLFSIRMLKNVPIEKSDTLPEILDQI